MNRIKNLMRQDKYDRGQTFSLSKSFLILFISFSILFILSISPCFAQSFAPHIPPQAIAYQRARRALCLFGMGWNVLGIWLFLRAGLAARLRDILSRGKRTEQELETISVPPFRSLLLYYAAFMGILLLWNLPISLMGLRIEHQYGFSTQTVFGFFRDLALSFGFELPAVLLFWGGLRLYARTPRHWWKILWAVSVPVIVFLFILEPVVVAPAFNRYTPLPDTPLRGKIIALASKAGITGANVFVEDTSKRTRHVNAYVTGIGPTTRIVINDTALQTLPKDQILAMLGHEMGHYVEGHIWAGMGGAIVGMGAFLWILSRLLPALVQRKANIWRLNGVTDLAAIPLLSLIITLFMIIQAPIANGISRYLEHRADAFGLRLTHLNDATVRLFIGFAERDYSDPDPPALLQFWFGTHPTLNERIKFAREYHD
jgi:STE24 endopeptidase